MWSPPHILGLWLTRARALFALVQISVIALSYSRCSVKVMPKYLYWLDSAICSFLKVKTWVDHAQPMCSLVVTYFTEKFMKVSMHA